MVLILDGNSEIEAHVRSNSCYLIYLRHWIRSRAVQKLIFFINELHACAICSELPFNIKYQLRISFYRQMFTWKKFTTLDSWYLYQMLTQKMMCTCQRKKVFFEEEKIRGVTTVELNKFLKHIKIPKLPHTCAPISE